MTNDQIKAYSNILAEAEELARVTRELSPAALAAMEMVGFGPKKIDALLHEIDQLSTDLREAIAPRQ